MKYFYLIFLLLLTLNDSVAEKIEIFSADFEAGEYIYNPDDDQSGQLDKIAGDGRWEAFDNHPNIGSFTIGYEQGDLSSREAKMQTSQAGDNTFLAFILYDLNVSDENGEPVKGRVQANVYGNNNLKDISVHIDAFFQRNILELENYPGTFHWLTVAEFWNNASWGGESYPFRISLGIAKIKEETGEPLYFQVHAQRYDTESENWHSVWKETSNQPIVANEWITLRYRIKEGLDRDGLFHLEYVRKGRPELGKEVVFSLLKTTHHPMDPNPDGFSEINPFKLYTGPKVIDFLKERDKSLRIFWDNFQLFKND